MAEPEDLLTDVARHATIYAQRLWQRHHKPPETVPTVRLRDIAERLDLFISSLFGTTYPLKVAQLPARPTLLARLLGHYQRPYLEHPIPATDGHSIWLPPDSFLTDREQAYTAYCVMALRQAMRAQRQSAALIDQAAHPLIADLYLVLEAYAADRALIELLPGMAATITAAQKTAMAKRPLITEFNPARAALEHFLRSLFTAEPSTSVPIPLCDSPKVSLNVAIELAASLAENVRGNSARAYGINPLLKDWWTGELRRAPDASPHAIISAATEDDMTNEPTRSSQLERRPEVREQNPDEDDNQEPGIWMVQGDEPHKHAEDPLGLQRPVDKDEETGAEEYAELVSELAEARLVATPTRPKEVLLSDDPPDTRSRVAIDTSTRNNRPLNYPEWDYRTQMYQNPGALVSVLPPQYGSQDWVDQILNEHHALLLRIRRQFEVLRARRVRQRKQLDGDEIDLDAYIDSQADFRAGSSLSEACYQVQRTVDRNTAITLLIDVSGSTDSWISNHRRIIDVEKEALLLVCIALEGLGEPYSVQAFSGQGRQAVTLREVKRFEENFSDQVALKISALEPERYTRAGAAVRHATAELMTKPAAHRLLILLSDGKPNDNDDYEGRYGVEDMKKAVAEAKLQNIFTFCLTVDRHAANYLPGIFGKNQYALLDKPDQLPRVLLEWLRRLIAS
jgi:nitric oxide reductase NorD protein